MIYMFILFFSVAVISKQMQGIGKSTIARALFDQLSNDFELRCFMGNLGGVVTCRSVTGVDDYDSKLKLQNQLQLLSEIAII